MIIILTPNLNQLIPNFLEILTLDNFAFLCRKWK